MKVLILILLSQLAQAKTLTLRWQAMADSAQYELEIQKLNAGLRRYKVKDPVWIGEIPSGQYVYRVRGFDWTGNPGEWTQSLYVLVPAKAPEIEGPKGEEIELKEGKANVSFYWQPVNEVTQYEFEWTKDGGAPEAVLLSTEKIQKSVSPGVYRWKVASVIPGGRVKFAEGKWEPVKVSSEWNTVTIRRKLLQTPDLVSPTGSYSLDDKRRVRFVWEPVNGAKGYELELIPDPSTPALPSQVVLEESSVDVSVPETGAYTWKVRALASLDGKGQKSEVSQATVNFDNPWLVPTYASAEFLGGFLNYTYKVTGLAITATSATGAGFDLGAQYWWDPNWSLALFANDEWLLIQDGLFDQKSILLGVNYRTPNLTPDGEEWVWSAGLGPQFQETFEVLRPEVRTMVAEKDMLGLGFRGSFGKMLSTRVSLSLIAKYFVPLKILGGNRNTDLVERFGANIGMGLEGGYAMSANVKLLIRAMFDNKALRWQGSDPQDAVLGTDRQQFVVMGGFRFDFK